jgi:hypothetical protein
MTNQGQQPENPHGKMEICGELLQKFSTNDGDDENDGGLREKRKKDKKKRD